MKKAHAALIMIASAVLITSVSATIAWYESGSTAYINEIEFGVNCERDFKISVDNNQDNLVESLSKDDLKAVEYFTPVTSMYSNQWISQGKSMPEFRDHYTRFFDEYYRPTCDVASRGFFSQELYLYLDYNMLATLDSTQTKVEANAALNKVTAAKLHAEKYPEKSVDEIEADLNRVADSIRISILDYSNADSPYTIIDPRKEGTTFYGGRLNNDEFDEYFDYVTHADGEQYEVLYGDYEVLDYVPYLPIATEDSELIGEPSCFNAKTKAGVHPIDMENLSKHVKFASEDSVSLEGADATLEATDSTKAVNIDLRAYEMKKIVLSFYIEGWDLDNTTVTSNAAFSISVAFKLNRETL